MGKTSGVASGTQADNAAAIAAAEAAAAAAKAAAEAAARAAAEAAARAAAEEAAQAAAAERERIIAKPTNTFDGAQGTGNTVALTGQAPFVTQPVVAAAAAPEDVTLAAGTGSVTQPAPPTVAWEAGLTTEQMQAIFTELTPEKANEYLPYLNAAMKEFGIQEPEEVKVFLAQIGHESAALGGNLRPGTDDVPFHEREGTEQVYAPYYGRGAIQITWDDNYKAAGDALGLDLLGNPDLAGEKEVAFRTAGWYWKENNLGALVDGSPESFTRVGLGIFAGNPDSPKALDGAESRQNWYDRVNAVMGDAPLGTGPVAVGYEQSAVVNATRESPGVPAYVQPPPPPPPSLLPPITQQVEISVRSLIQGLIPV